MCSHSVSGSSLLSGYDEDDVRETSGRSRQEFEQIDAVLYQEELPKRSTLKKICDEWSSKPHFRVRGRTFHFHRQENLQFTMKIPRWTPLTTQQHNQMNNSLNSHSHELHVSSIFSLVFCPADLEDI